ncbi:M24 family metallopeptidase [Tenuibacillus multivorans]|uniref:Xaa-Pro dipeptidase n=1 Tax=Tenuibacillus multivorans TaxID=237069 RepID=A0A1G9YH66_9BACI|nr:M24 family metallopeptidase [Tenuibacillus multivorans]GEL78534.1 ectoine hydrolase DoeA [Tenuibacillus multivorans]SDN07865.1 Xaa-Pro dipeptidase [Tenuibacillus multivorans]
MLDFDILEYQERLERTKKSMEKQGIEVLLITDPANMNYLSGYDAWSFYVHQMLVVIIDEPQPIWIGRYMDATGAKSKTWMYDENIMAYPDYYVQSDRYHPMEFVAEILEEIGHGNRVIAVEKEQYYFTAKAYEVLKAKLPNATFKDGTLLVNWVRIHKSDQEIEYMRKAAMIAERSMQAGLQSIHTGSRECDAAASIFFELVKGTEEFGGDYPSIVPMLPTGENTSTPHLTWSDAYFEEGNSVIVELAGCYKRYHCPLARTAFIGQPPEYHHRLASIVAEGMEEVIAKVKPGIYLEELEEAWRKSTRKYGIEKESRLGYSLGLNYPPDWGEHTASIRKGDKTVLQPNMTFHFIPGIWEDHYGLEMSESFRVTETGIELFTNYPRELLVQSPFQLPDGSNGIIS